MHKTRLNNAAKKFVNNLLWDTPNATFVALRHRADDAYGTDEGLVIDAAIAILEAREDVARAAYRKLVADLQAINPYLNDENVAGENLRSGCVEGCVTFWADFFSAVCGVVACYAQDKGIDINARLGYSIY